MVKKIAVCDDEQALLKQIDSYLKQFQEDTKEKFEVFYFSSAEDLMNNMPRDIHIVLLDIQMKEKTGMEAARILREEGLNFYLFFITSHVEFALEGYEVHAYAFLQKPLQYSHFKRYLLDICNKINTNKKNIIKIKNGANTEVINTDDIVYIEVFHHSTLITYKDSKKEYTITLTELENKLKEFGFFRCHKSYLLNFKYIKNYEFDTIQLSNSCKIPLSKHRRKEFLEQYTQYLGDLL